VADRSHPPPPRDWLFPFARTGPVLGVLRPNRIVVPAIAALSLAEL
jgi:hypothetical protein